jgi:1,4-alpha-glucan branching enzyme
MHFVLALHSHLPYVLNHGRWPHGSDWITEAAIDTYLPMLAHLRELRDADVDAPVTIGFTPVLANQLAHPTFVHELELYFDQRLAACTEAAESLDSHGERALGDVARFWHARLTQLRRLFHAIDRDLVTAFRRLEEAGRLEIIGSAATHGFLPLLGRDESIRLQLALGRAEHVRLFGRAPRGCWVPECAYRPRGWWEPIPGNTPNYGMRRGTDEHLEDAGFEYFFADAHMVRRSDAQGGETHPPYLAYDVSLQPGSPRAVSAFIRDPTSSAQVWSRHGGYPGASEYLEFHKIRYPGGLKLWRVSGSGVDLGWKQPYVPAWATGRATEHGRHFASMLAGIEHEQHRFGTDVIVAPFDTELFGHWWFEGPQFVSDVFRALRHHPRVRPVTASQHLKWSGRRPAVRLRAGSWGADGDYSMWMGPQTSYTWPRIWGLENAFWGLAGAALAEPGAHRALAQAARTLLLVQSSDWQFIISTGEVADYAQRRFHHHAADADRLLEALRRGLAGGGFDAANGIAAELRTRDDLFPDVLPSIAAALRGGPMA